MSKRESISNAKTNASSNKIVWGFEVLKGTEMLKLLVFIGILAVPYVYYSHVADKKHRTSEKVKNELKELRAEYITLKSQIVGQNKQSDVAKRLKDRGLVPIHEAPIDLNEETD